MNRLNQATRRFLLLPRWSLLGLSAGVPLIVLTLILLSASLVTAEPASPAADIYGGVLTPYGDPLSYPTAVRLAHLDSWGYEDWDTYFDTEVDGSFNFTGTIPGEYLPGDFVLQACAPWETSYYDSLPTPIYIMDNMDLIDVGGITLTFPSFEGMVYEPDGSTLAQRGWVEVLDGEMNGVAYGEYGDTGWYEVGAVPSGEFMLVAHPHEDSLLASSAPISVSVLPGSQYDPEATQYIDLILQEPNVYGWVVYPGGSPATWIMSGTGTLFCDVIGYAEVKAVNADWTVDVSRPTISSGEFGIHLPSDSYEMWAEPQGVMAMTHTRSIPQPVAIQAGDPLFETGPMTLTFPSFAGEVFDPEGNPIPACVSVWLEDVMGNWMVDYWYCPEGLVDQRAPQQEAPYKLGGIPGGDYWLMAEGLPEFGLLPPEPIFVHVPPGSQYDPSATLFFDLFLEPAAGPLAVEVVDPSGTPVPANVVLMDEWGYEEWLLSTPGDPALFMGMAPGEYWAQAWPLGQDIPILANSEPAPVFIDIGPLTITLELLHPNVIGVVETPEGNPLPPAHTELGTPTHPAEIGVHNDDWSMDIWAATNMTGAFSLALPDDHYTLGAHPFASLVHTYTKSLPVDFWTPDPGAAPLDLGYITLTYPCVWGWVTDLDENRVSAWVDLWSVDEDYGEGDETLWSPPDVEKPFRFGGLLPGHYAVRSGPPYDDPGAYGSSNIVDFIVPDECGQEISLTLEMANFIGYLLLPPDAECSECPVPWAEVKLRNAAGTFEDWTTTDEMGRFAFSGLDLGAYVVKAFVPEELQFEWDPPPRELFTLTSPDDLVERVMYLQRAIRNKHVIGAVVYDDDGSPVGDGDGDGVGDALVYAYHDDTGYWVGKPNMPDGTYALDLKGGLWWVGVEPMHPDVDWFFNPDWEQPVWFEHNLVTETASITLTVARAEFFHVTGVVTTPSGAPIVPGSVEVALCDDEGGCFGNPVEPNGDFELRALPGIYRFWIHVDPASHLLPPLDNGFDLFVDEDLDLGMFWLRAIGDRTATVSGRVIIRATGEGLAGVMMEAWTDTGDWNETETVAGGNYALDLLPGHWHGGPVLSEEQQEQYVLLPPRRREGHLEAGETISNVNFYLARRDATIEGYVVDISTTLPISDIEAIVFAEYCPPDATLHCYIVAESKVWDGAFELGVVGDYTYTLGIWILSDGYMAGPPVEVFVDRGETADADMAVIEAGTRIHGYLLDPDDERVYLPASVYGHEPTSDYWVEDHLWPEKDPYEYELWVPTPESEPANWTLWLGVPPHTGYTPDPAHPEYPVVVPPGETNILQIMYVRGLDTLITGTVKLFDGTNLISVPYVWVFAEGLEGTDTEGMFFEVETNEDGHFVIPVLPGEYMVGAFLPPHLADDFLPPPPKPWDSMDDNPVILKFRPRPTGAAALSISGSLSVSPTGALADDAPIQIIGWSAEEGHSLVTGTLAGGYDLPVISDTVWYVWAVYEDHDNDALYLSTEKRVVVRDSDVTGVNLALELADFPLPDPVCESFDPTVFKRISLPTRPGAPEPLIEIQAGTMPVSGTVEICATPILGVPRGHLLVGFAYELEARDSQGNLISEDFNKSVRMIFYYNADMLGDADPEELEPAFYSTARQEWVMLEDVYIDPSDWFVTGKIDHFTKMGVLSAAPTEDNYIYLPIILRDFGG